MVAAIFLPPLPSTPILGGYLPNCEICQLPSRKTKSSDGEIHIEKVGNENNQRRERVVVNEGVYPHPQSKVEF